ncbi:MAG: hypothetical protein OZ914_09075 [Anaerolineaceae bacterium]|jgi:hypothetical protein|nr:hypothetical protein [Anaerolineaceae bacterium]OQY88672.1 MAG: hypothetical protein B6D38_09910 [Anaerolineae bacterium UTCFX1]
MRNANKLFAVLNVLLLAALACNLPGTSPASTQPPANEPATTDESVSINLDEALTLAVQTLQAATLTAAVPTQTVTPGPSPAPPSTAPIVSVSSDTNCRTGPNANYPFVILFKVGQTANVVGKYTPNNYWIIEYPGGFGATCWLWGAYATVLGDTNGLPEGIPPPLPPTVTPAPSAPQAPKQLGFSCTSVNKSKKVGQIWMLAWEWTVQFSWSDQSTNEDGFYVYKDGVLLTTVGPNVESYTDVFTHMLVINPVTYTYSVQAYNSDGSSALRDKEISSCQ